MEPPRLDVAVDTRERKFAVVFVPPGSDVGLEVEEETYEDRGSRITLSPGMSPEAIQRALDSFEPLKELASRPFVVRRNRFYLNLHDEPHQLRLEYLSGHIQDVIHVLARPSQPHLSTMLPA